MEERTEISTWSSDELLNCCQALIDSPIPSLKIKPSSYRKSHHSSVSSYVSPSLLLDMVVMSESLVEKACCEAFESLQFGERNIRRKVTNKTSDSKNVQINVAENAESLEKYPHRLLTNVDCNCNLRSECSSHFCGHDCLCLDSVNECQFNTSFSGTNSSSSSSDNLVYEFINNFNKEQISPHTCLPNKLWQWEYSSVQGESHPAGEFVNFGSDSSNHSKAMICESYTKAEMPLIADGSSLQNERTSQSYDQIGAIAESSASFRNQASKDANFPTDFNKKQIVTPLEEMEGKQRAVARISLSPHRGNLRGALIGSEGKISSFSSVPSASLAPAAQPSVKHNENRTAVVNLSAKGFGFQNPQTNNTGDPLSGVNSNFVLKVRQGDRAKDVEVPFKGNVSSNYSVACNIQRDLNSGANDSHVDIAIPPPLFNMPGGKGKRSVRRKKGHHLQNVENRKFANPEVKEINKVDLTVKRSTERTAGLCQSSMDPPSLTEKVPVTYHCELSCLDAEDNRSSDVNHPSNNSDVFVSFDQTPPVISLGNSKASCDSFNKRFSNLYHASPALVIDTDVEGFDNCNCLSISSTNEICCSSVDTASKDNKNYVSSEMQNKVCCSTPNADCFINNKTSKLISVPCQKSVEFGTVSDQVASDDFYTVEKINSHEYLYKNLVGHVSFLVDRKTCDVPLYSFKFFALVESEAITWNLATSGTHWSLGSHEKGLCVYFSSAMSNTIFDTDSNLEIGNESVFISKLDGFVVASGKNDTVKNLVPVFSPKSCDNNQDLSSLYKFNEHKKSIECDQDITSCVKLRPKKSAQNENRFSTNRKSAACDVQMYRTCDSFYPTEEAESFIQDARGGRPIKLCGVFLHPSSTNYGNQEIFNAKRHSFDSSFISGSAPLIYPNKGSLLKDGDCNFTVTNNTSISIALIDEHSHQGTVRSHAMSSPARDEITPVMSSQDLEYLKEKSAIKVSHDLLKDLDEQKVFSNSPALLKKPFSKQFSDSIEGINEIANNFAICPQPDILTPTSAEVMKPDLLSELSEANGCLVQLDSHFGTSASCSTQFSIDKSYANDSVTLLKENISAASSADRNIVSQLTSASYLTSACSVTQSSPSAAKMSVLPIIPSIEGKIFSKSSSALKRSSFSCSSRESNSLSKEPSLILSKVLDFEKINRDLKQKHNPLNRSTTDSNLLKKGTLNKKKDIGAFDISKHLGTNSSIPCQTKFPMDIICQGRLKEMKLKAALPEEFPEDSSTVTSQHPPEVLPRRNYPTVRSKSISDNIEYGKIQMKNSNKMKQNFASDIKTSKQESFKDILTKSEFSVVNQDNQHEEFELDAAKEPNVPSCTVLRAPYATCNETQRSNSVSDDSIQKYQPIVVLSSYEPQLPVSSYSSVVAPLLTISTTFEKNPENNSSSSFPPLHLPEILSSSTTYFQKEISPVTLVSTILQNTSKIIPETFNIKLDYSTEKPEIYLENDTNSIISLPVVSAPKQCLPKKTKLFESSTVDTDFPSNFENNLVVADGPLCSFIFPDSSLVSESLVPINLPSDLLPSSSTSCDLMPTSSTSAHVIATSLFSLEGKHDLNSSDSPLPTLIKEKDSEADLIDDGVTFPNSKLSLTSHPNYELSSVALIPSYSVKLDKPFCSLFASDDSQVTNFANDFGNGKRERKARSCDETKKVNEEIKVKATSTGSKSFVYRVTSYKEFLDDDEGNFSSNGEPGSSCVESKPMFTSYKELQPVVDETVKLTSYKELEKKISYKEFKPCLNQVTNYLEISPSLPVVEDNVKLISYKEFTPSVDNDTSFNLNLAQMPISRGYAKTDIDSAKILAETHAKDSRVNILAQNEKIQSNYEDEQPCTLPFNNDQIYDTKVERLCQEMSSLHITNIFEEGLSSSDRPRNTLAENRNELLEKGESDKGIFFSELLYESNGDIEEFADSFVSSILDIEALVPLIHNNENESKINHDVHDTENEMVVVKPIACRVSLPEHLTPVSFVVEEVVNFMDESSSSDEYEDPETTLDESFKSLEIESLEIPSLITPGLFSSTGSVATVVDNSTPTPSPLPFSEITSATQTHSPNFLTNVTFLSRTPSPQTITLCSIRSDNKTEGRSPSPVVIISHPYGRTSSPLDISISSPTEEYDDKTPTPTPTPGLTFIDDLPYHQSQENHLHGGEKKEFLTVLGGRTLSSETPDCSVHPSPSFKGKVDDNSTSSYDRPSDKKNELTAVSISSTGSVFSWSSTQGPVARRDLLPLEDDGDRCPSWQALLAVNRPDSDDERSGYESDDDFETMDVEMRRLEEKLKKFEMELGLTSGGDVSFEKTKSDSKAFSRPRLRPEDIDVLKTFPLPDVYPAVDLRKTKHFSLMNKKDLVSYEDCEVDSVRSSFKGSSMESGSAIFVKSRKKLKKGDRRCKSLDLKKSTIDQKEENISDADLNRREPSTEQNSAGDNVSHCSNNQVHKLCDEISEVVQNPRLVEFKGVEISLIENDVNVQNSDSIGQTVQTPVILERPLYSESSTEHSITPFYHSKELAPHSHRSSQCAKQIFEYSEQSYTGYLWHEESSGMTAFDFEGLEDIDLKGIGNSLMFIFEDDDLDESFDYHSCSVGNPEGSDLSLYHSTDSKIKPLEQQYCDFPRKKPDSLVSAFKNSFKKAAKYLGPINFSRNIKEDAREEDESLKDFTYELKSSTEGADTGKYHVPTAVVHNYPVREKELGDSSLCSSGDYHASPAVCVNTSEEEQTAFEILTKSSVDPTLHFPAAIKSNYTRISDSSAKDIQNRPSCWFDTCSDQQRALEGGAVEQSNTVFCVTGVKSFVEGTSSQYSPSCKLPTNEGKIAFSYGKEHCYCDLSSRNQCDDDINNESYNFSKDSRTPEMLSHKPTSIKQLKRKQQERIDNQKAENDIEKASGCTFCMGMAIPRRRIDHSDNHNRHPSPHPKVLPERRTWPPRVSLIGTERDAAQWMSCPFVVCRRPFDCLETNIVLSHDYLPVFDKQSPFCVINQSASYLQVFQELDYPLSSSSSSSIYSFSDTSVCRSASDSDPLWVPKSRFADNNKTVHSIPEQFFFAKFQLQQVPSKYLSLGPSSVSENTSLITPIASTTSNNQHLEFTKIDPFFPCVTESTKIHDDEHVFNIFGDPFRTSQHQPLLTRSETPLSYSASESDLGSESAN